MVKKSFVKMISRTVRRSILMISNRHFSTNRSENFSDAHNYCEHSKKQPLKDLLDSSTIFVDTKPVEAEDKWATLPYAEGTILTKRERHELDIERPKVDPRDTSIILFPGQGSQFVGMAKSLDRVPAAKDLFDYASEVLNYDVFKLCNEGPKSQLNDIAYGHVAIVVSSLATLELLKEERPAAILNCVGTAGFSVGEISSLIFAGALPFDQGIQLVQLRAEAMKAASSLYKGEMASIIFGPDSKVLKACKRAREHCASQNIQPAVCTISNYMYPRYKVLSGNIEAIKYIEDNLDKFRIRSLKRIKGSAAYHSKLMQPAVEPFVEALNKIQIEDPLIRVYSNVNFRPYFNANHIRKQLPFQLVQPVKWEQTMTYLYARRRGNCFPRTIVCGPGHALKSILKNVNLRAWRETIKIGDNHRPLNFNI